MTQRLLVGAHFPTAEACTEKSASDQQGCQAARLQLREMRGTIRMRNFQRMVYLLFCSSRCFTKFGQLPTSKDLNTLDIFSQRLKLHECREHRMPGLVPDQALIATST